MKKVIIFLLVLCSVLFAFTSCGAVDKNQVIAIETEPTEENKELYGFVILAEGDYWNYADAYDPESLAMYRVIRTFMHSQYRYSFVPLYNSDGTIRQYIPEETMENQFE